MEATDRIKKLELFEGLPEGDLKSLSRSAQLSEIRQGHFVFKAGEPAEKIVIVCYGAVKLSRLLPNGDEVIMAFLARGDVFGAVVALKESGTYPLSAIAVEDSAVFTINKKVFKELWQSHPVLGPRLLEQISKRISDMHSHLSHTTSSVPKRIAAFLMRTLKSQPHDLGNHIAIRLTRQDIASSVGTTVESVIRTLSQWTQKKYISTTDHRIDVLDEKAIREIANSNE